ncbi:MAG: MBL fold metallo-hydrolase [Firmicutes bacterium]|nr:MBL fold metallo-hydrolase [Bacillota bacterium]
MKRVLYQGHGSLRLIAGDTVIYVDPYAGEGYDIPADLILVTHQHYDHNRLDLPARKESCRVFQNMDAIQNGKYVSFYFNGIHIEPVQACNKNHPIDECVGYVLTLADGTKIYFAGDTSKTEQMYELAGRKLDYAFLPMDGIYNMDIPEAIECAEIIKAKCTIPVHMAPGQLFDMSRAKQFVTESAMIVEAGEEIDL